MHGAGIIRDIVSERVGGVTQDYYVFTMPMGGLLLKIPVANSDMVGLRSVVDGRYAEEVFSAVSGLEVDMTANWNRRYRENMERIKSGDLYEVARVIKGLSRRDSQQGLSTGERKMLHSAKQILISELVLSQDASYEDMERRVNTAMS